MNFPSNPTLNQLYTFGSKTWKWNGVAWELLIASINADTLGGNDASYFLAASAYTAADIRTKLLTVDGVGSGIDADLLDGQQGSYYLAASSYSAADVLAKLLTVDGASSAIDADLLDGQHGSHYLAFANMTGTASNAQLANSSVTVGSTAISLGAAATTIAGLTSVTSTTFVGALTGNASTATSAATLTTGRTIAITGAVTGTATSFNGSANISIPITAIDLTSTAYTGVLGVDHLGTGTPNGTKFLRDDGTWQAPTASAAWGSITGTMSAQADLNTALGLLAPKLNPTFSGKIFGDFSNATPANRTMFQDATTNGTTSVSAVPNGTATTALFAAFNNSNPANAGTIQLRANSTEMAINSAKTGTGTTQDIVFQFDSVNKARITTAGDVFATNYTAGGRFTANQADANWGVLLNNAAGSAARGGLWLDGTSIQMVYSDFIAKVGVYSDGNVRIDGNSVGIGGAPLGSASKLAVHANTVGVQTGHYALCQSGSRIWQLGIETDRGFRIWSYSDAGAYMATPFAMDRAGNAGFTGSLTLAGDGAPGASGHALRVSGSYGGGIQFTDGGLLVKLLTNNAGTPSFRFAFGTTERHIFYSNGDLAGVGSLTAATVTSQGEFYSNGWFRSNLSGTGWYHQVHGGGWFMQDSTWIRTYNSKGVLITGPGGSTGDLRLESASPTIAAYDNDAGTTHWIHCNDGNHGFLANNSFAWCAYRDGSNNWTVTNNIVAFASDERLKSGVEDVSMDLVNRVFANLRIRKYDWDAEKIASYNVQIEPKANQIGGIAQEVQRAYPDAVVINTAHNPIPEKGKTKIKHDFLTIQWEKFIPLLIAKVQEQDKRIKELEGRTV